MADDSHKYGDTHAARMLTDGLKKLRERNVSLRKLAPLLGYKQATVLSHMANGRIPVPIKKAPEIAKVVDLPQSEFLMAVMDQRQNQGEDRAHFLAAGPLDFELGESFASELEEIAGGSLDSLTPEQKDILRKVVLDKNPARRWLSEAEIPTVQLLRRLRPSSEHAGLDARDRALIAQALEAKVD